MSEGDKTTQSFILNAIPDTLVHSKPCGLAIGKCTYTVRAWKDILRETCTHLYSKRQTTFLKYRNALVPNSIGRIWIKKRPTSFTSPFKVDNNVWIETNFSANDLLKRTSDILTACRVPIETVAIEYSAVENNPDIPQHLGPQTASPAKQETLFDLKAISADIDRKKGHAYSRVLSERFPRGLTVGSTIDLMRFRIFWKELFGMDCGDTDREIATTLECIGIDCGKRIMAPSTVMPVELKDRIVKYIENAFEAGQTAIYFSPLFELFAPDFCATNVYNDQILKRVIAFYLGEKYHIKRSFLTIDTSFNGSPEAEVEATLMDNVMPMSLTNLSEALPHIPPSKIRHTCLSLDNIFATGTNEFVHIGVIHFDDAVLTIARNLIDAALESYGYLATNQLLKGLKDRCPSFFEINAAIPDIGLRKALALKLKETYDFSDAVISRKGANLNLARLLIREFGGCSELSVQTLHVFMEHFDARSTLGVHGQDLFDLFLHVDADTFVNKGCIQFDTAGIDAILDRFCTGAYIPLTAVTSFSLFPGTGFAWTTFLLESYVAGYSEKFRLLKDSYSLNRSVGAIVKRTAGYEDYDAILSDALAHARCLSLDDSDAAIVWLYEQGYLAMRSLKRIQDVTHAAKCIRKRIGSK